MSLYNYRWQRLSQAFLRMHPACVMCLRHDCVTVATVVDHKIPHRGDMVLFWDQSNWQSLCKAHHDGAKRRQEHRGYLGGCDVHGQPLDANHHWNK